MIDQGRNHKLGGHDNGKGRHQAQAGRAVADVAPLGSTKSTSPIHQFSDARGVDRWNKTIREEGIDFEIRLPHRRFNRKMGIHAGLTFDPEGNAITEEQFEAGREKWLPGASDRVHVNRLMQPVLEPGKIAQWLAPPTRGINGQAFDYEYVRRV